MVLLLLYLFKHFVFHLLRCLLLLQGLLLLLSLGFLLLFLFELGDLFPEDFVELAPVLEHENEFGNLLDFLRHFHEFLVHLLFLGLQLDIEDGQPLLVFLAVLHVLVFSALSLDVRQACLVQTVQQRLLLN